MSGSSHPSQTMSAMKAYTVILQAVSATLANHPPTHDDVHSSAAKTQSGTSGPCTAPVRSDKKLITDHAFLEYEQRTGGNVCPYRTALFCSLDDYVLNSLAHLVNAEPCDPCHFHCLGHCGQGAQQLAQHTDPPEAVGCNPVCQACEAQLTSGPY